MALFNLLVVFGNDLDTFLKPTKHQKKSERCEISNLVCLEDESVFSHFPANQPENITNVDADQIAVCK